MINRSTKKLMWSEEDTRKLFKMAKDGVAIEEIYAAFPERPKAGIDNKLHRQGFSAAKRK